MSYHLAVGFIFGVSISALISLMGMELGNNFRKKDEESIFTLLEEINDRNDLIDELIKENKAYKKVYDNFNEERNADYWGQI